MTVVVRIINCELDFRTVSVRKKVFQERSRKASLQLILNNIQFFNTNFLKKLPPMRSQNTSFLKLYAWTYTSQLPEIFYFILKYYGIYDMASLFIIFSKLCLSSIKYHNKI